MGAQPGENRFEAFQNHRAESAARSINETVNQLQKMNISFPNIHSASLCVSEHLKKLEDRSVHRSPSTLLKNSNFRLCIQSLVRKSSVNASDDRSSIIAQIKIKRLEDEVKRLTKALAIRPTGAAQAQPAIESAVDTAEANKLCILISEMLKHADFLFDIDHQKRIITKAGKYSSDRFITPSENISPYFSWLEQKASLLRSIGADRGIIS